MSKFVKPNQFQNPPYATTIDLIDELKIEIPDSLQYLLEDMFKTITLYDNKMVEVSTTVLDDGQYEVKLKFNASQYRSDEKGNRYFSESFANENNNSLPHSLPLSDYIDIWRFTTALNAGKSVEIYLKKHKITAIKNEITLVVDHLPTKAGVDPYSKLIDTNRDDNSMAL